MNIQDRIAKLEKELKQLKIDLAEDEEITEVVWKPRKGEIVEMSDDGEVWVLRRYYGTYEHSYLDNFKESWMMCRRLNDPMVIQLIPHKPGDPRPYGDANNVIVVFKSGYYDAANPREFDWDDDNDEANIVGWFDIT